MTHASFLMAAVGLAGALGLYGGMRASRPAPAPEILAIVAAARQPDPKALGAAMAAAQGACGGEAGDPACAPAGLAGRAIASFGMGKDPEVEVRIWKGAAAFAQRAGGDGTDAYLGLARLEGYRGRMLEAESAYRRALETARKVRGPGHASLAEILQEAGLLVALGQRWTSAERYLREALAIRQAGAVPAPIPTASILQDLAGVLASQARLPEAEEAARRAVALREEAADDDREGLAGALQALARILGPTRRAAEVAGLLGRAVGLLEAEFGADHPLLLEPLLELAAAEAAAGREAAARARFEAAVAIEKASSPESDRARTAYAAFAAERGARGAGAPPRQ